MMFAAVLLLFTVTNLSHALDDDDPDTDQKYTVSFFQFNPKDLALPGFGRREPSKKHVKRSDAASENISPPVNVTLMQLNATNNATVTTPSNDSTPAVNSTAAISPDNSTTANVQSTTANVQSTTANVQSTIANGTSAMTRDVDIMNQLIEIAMRKRNTSASQRDQTTEPKATIDITGKFESSNTSVIDPKINLNVKDGNSSAGGTKRTFQVVKKSDIAPYDVDARRKNALNPNPKPSADEALLNLKHPKQLENKPHDSNIHADNTTKVTETENKHAETTNIVSMEKNEKLTNETAPVIVPTNKTNTVMNTSTPTPEEAEKAKLAKDKQTNKEIKENAKDIKPVQDTVGQMNMTIHDSMKDDVIGKEVKETSKAVEEKKKQHRSKVSHLDEEGKKKHRKIVSKFVPLYKTTVKDHKLSFQIGAMKHPKHNIHPKCHGCPMNSTYKECVKKSTLLECNQGLDNICFTKSTKQNGLITYQMGCSNHNKCVTAKAFPCKDDHQHCFTCCQFDRCNSSPHHGDYELDQLNLAELSDSVVDSDNKETTNLDSTSATDNISGSWMLYASTCIVILALKL